MATEIRTAKTYWHVQSKEAVGVSRIYPGNSTFHCLILILSTPFVICMEALEELRHPALNDSVFLEASPIRCGMWPLDLILKTFLSS